MRTVILLGAILIADASRIRSADANSGGLMVVILLISVVMDIWEFIHRITRK